MEEANQNTQQVPQPPVSPPPVAQSPVDNIHSNETKTIVTVLLLIFVYPVGLLIMWLWTKWPKWVKWLVSAPLIIGIVAIILGFILIATLPHASTIKQ